MAHQGEWGGCDLDGLAASFDKLRQELIAEVGWIAKAGHLRGHLGVIFWTLARGKSGWIALVCSLGSLPDICHDCHCPNWLDRDARNGAQLFLCFYLHGVALSLVLGGIGGVRWAWPSPANLSGAEGIRVGQVGTGAEPTSFKECPFEQMLMTLPPAFGA
jgi:hypothetical protein